MGLTPADVVRPRTPDASGVSGFVDRVEIQELRRRTPRLMWVSVVAFTALAVSDLLLPPPGASGAMRLYLFISAVAVVLMAGVLSQLIPRLRSWSSNQIEMLLVALETLIANVLLARSIPIGGDTGYLLGAACLILVLFARTIGRPMTGPRAVLTATIIWTTFPICVALTRLITGAWPTLPVNPVWTWVSLGFLFVVSTGMAAAGSAVLYGMRRSQLQAEHATRYELGERIGAGGMGEVYSATHGTLKCNCAVKTCSVPEGVDPDEAFARFSREAQSVARLQHPNIVRVFDFGELDDGRLYYAMEYLPGIALDTFLAQHGPVPEARLVHWADQILSALAEAHRAGIVHRDLKPANLIVSSLGGEPDVVTVLDFGLAKLVEGPEADADLTQGGATAGTPAYMAPEQIEQRDAVDGRTDLYALGAVLWHLAAGEPVFSGETVMSVLVKHASHEAPRLDTHTSVSAQLTDIVAKLLVKLPGGRYPHATAVREALRECPTWGAWTREQARAWWEQHGRPDASTAEALPTAPLPPGVLQTVDG